MKRISTLEEQLNRMKSLMTEERLYGNLIDNKEKKIVIQEQSLAKRIARMLKGPDINIPKLNKSRIAKINAAFKNLDSKNIDMAAFKAQIAALYKNVGNDSSPHIQKLLTKLNYPANDIAWLTNQIELMEKYILNGLHKGKSASEIADDLGKNFTTDDVIDMVGIVYGNNKGIKSRLKIGEGNVYAKQDKDYLDINTNKGKEADSKFKTKLEDLAIRTQKVTNMPEELQAATKQIDEAIESGGKTIKMKGGKTPTPDEPATMVTISKTEQSLFGPSGDFRVLYPWKIKSWSNSEGIIIKTIKGLFYRIRVKPATKMWDWITRDSLISNYALSRWGAKFLRFAISYAPIEMELWALYNKFAPHVECDYTDDLPYFSCEYNGEKTDIHGKTIEVGDDPWTIAGTAFMTILKASPIIGLVSGHYPAVVGKWLIKETGDAWRNKLELLMRLEYLCCPVTPANLRVDDEINYWETDCEQLENPKAGCLFPEGIPSCEKFFNKVINPATVKEDDPNSLKNKWKKQIEDSMSATAIANLLLKWGGQPTLDEHIENQIKTTLPTSEAFCTYIGKNVDWGKIEDDLKKDLEELEKGAEEAGEVIVDKLGVGQVAVEQAIQPYVWDGRLDCSDWKESPMFSDPKFDEILGSVDESGDLIFEDSIEGFISYYCPGLKAHNASVNNKNCSAGIKAACGITE